jgi:MoxR-like ATPase
MTSNDLRLRLDSFCDDVLRLEAEIGRVVVGQRDVVRGVVIALIAGGHILLEGVPGLGKTLLVRTLASAVDGKFSRIQFTPDLMPADITGTNIITEDASGNRHFRFQPGPVFANIVLADEVNRATPKTQSALLEAMQDRSVTVGSTTHKLDEMFFVLATQNPLEMTGTYPLPEAQLDRFFCKILVPFPTADELHSIVNRTTTNEQPTVSSTFPVSRILELSRLARDVPVVDGVTRYAVELVLRTHPELPQASKFVRKNVRYGASPRGAQALILAAKISAILDERYNVSRDDINSVAQMVLRHRIILSFDGVLDGVSADEVVCEVMK